MKRFRFRLHALSKLLGRDLRAHQIQLARAVDVERGAHRKVVEIKRAQERATAAPASRPPKIDPTARDQLARYLAASDQALTEARIALAQSRDAVDQARSAVQQAQIEVRRIERLKELQERRHRASAVRREIVQLDELGARRRRDWR
jgi:flagellar export protein FliJ